MTIAIPKCVQCADVALTPIQPSPNNIEFFECPKCYRAYARKSGGTLTFRWPHPVSLALYAALFATEPIQIAPDVAERFASQRSAEEMIRIVDEIEIELQHPTQNVRDILDNSQTEDQCRAFLRAFVACVRAKLGRVR